MKIIFTTLLVILSFSFCKAQWVTIPDANFVAWLQANYPSCMNGNQMNTSCPDILNEYLVNCSFQNISDLTGIQYFVNLWQLDCSSNQLTFLPELPNSVTIVDCSINQISYITNLPNSIVTLGCSYNNLTSLPPLPTSLYDFGCASNYLTSFPSIPPSLIWLDVSDNYLSGLPALENIESLGCGHNSYFNLPVFTNNLVALYCEYDNLQSLPTLPPNLQYLSCQFNSIESLPSIPNTLIQLICDHNLLKTLPSLPSSLNEFNIGSNPEIKCMPVLQNFTGGQNQFEILGTGITCFPNAIQHTGYISQIDNTPICSCTYPSGISTSNITSTSAKVNWSTECCSEYRIQYRVTGTTTWTTKIASPPLTTKTLIALTPATTYDLRMRVTCTDGTSYSSWSPIQTFTTMVTCVAPTGLTVSNLSQTHATINWNAVANAYSYKFQGRKLGTTAWTNYTIYAPLTFKTLNGLTANTTYQYKLQTVCNASGIPTSPWTTINTFTTLLRMEDESSENATIDFSVYPNPVSEQLTVICNQLTVYEIGIKDLLGRVLMTQQVSEESSTTIDVSNLSAAQYFVFIRKNDGSVLIKQFVKE